MDPSINLHQPCEKNINRIEMATLEPIEKLVPSVLLAPNAPLDLLDKTAQIVKSGLTVQNEKHERIDPNEKRNELSEQIVLNKENDRESYE